MWGTFLMLLIAAVFWYVLNRTAYGRHLYATGDDPESARLAGIDTDRILFSVYVVAGIIAAIAGWALIGRVGAISPTAGENMNLDSITAVVIGGTSLFGGRGSMVGTLVGAFFDNSNRGLCLGFYPGEPLTSKHPPEWFAKLLYDCNHS